MTRPQHACPVKGCRGYALGGDDEQEGAQHHRKRGDNVLQMAAKPRSLYATSNAVWHG